MATIKHSIEINSNPLLQAGRNVRATRTSKSRRYEACLVATATVTTVERQAAALVEHEKTIAELTPVLEGLLAVWGLKSHEEVKAIHEAQCKPWYPILFEAEHAAREAKRGRDRFAQLTDADRKAVTASLVAQGHVNPYEQKEWTFLELARKLEGATRAAEHLKERNLQVGQQFVLSWHKDRNNALKAKGSASTDYYLKQAYTVEIRTDITIES